MSGGLIADAPTGLYGWMRSNDARSLQFFAMFAVAAQLLAALVLFLPLTLLDEDHSPLFGPLGYLARYSPIVFLASLAIFGAQLFWYMETVRKRAGFRFVDGTEEPRLCALAEPLIVMMDMKPPFVAVIESAACNAFACGISRKHAVLVVTRGLLDTLSDDELQCVLAHELAHVKNGDIRMMAAANICMANLRKLDNANVLQFRSWLAGLWCLAFPVFFPLMLFGGLVGQAALRAAWRARFTIISSREFIADAMAVQLTKNPAALASALTRIRGREEIEGLTGKDDSMMIAGRSEGPDATHPQIEDRVEALARVTGPLVFNAPDAAPVNELGDAVASAALRGSRRPGVRQRAWSAFGIDPLGMTRISRIACAATIAVFLAIHAPDLGNARAMGAKFDFRVLGYASGLNELRCAQDGIDWETCRAEAAVKWREFGSQRGTVAGALAKNNIRLLDENGEPSPLFSGFGGLQAYTGQSGKLTGVLAPIDDRGRFVSGFMSTEYTIPEKYEIAELDQVGCIPAHFIQADEPITGVSLTREYGSRNLPGMVAAAKGAAVRYERPSEDGRREWMERYLFTREDLVLFSYYRFGLEGLQQVRDAYDSAEHDAVIFEIRQQAAQPRFTAGLDALKRAKLRALLRDPDRFLPCPAVKFGA